MITTQKKFFTDIQPILTRARATTAIFRLIVVVVVLALAAAGVQTWAWLVLALAAFWMVCDGVLAITIGLTGLMGTTLGKDTHSGGSTINN